MNKFVILYQNYLVKYERILFLIGLGGLGFFLPLVPYATSVAQFWLIGHWLLTGKYDQKIRNLKNNRLTFLFIGIYAIHFLGLFYSGNTDYGLFDLRRKLPLLAIPLMLASNSRLNKTELSIVLHLFVLAVFISSILSYFNYLGVGGFTYTNIREISRIFSHIRLALFVCMAIAMLLWFIQCRSGKKWILTYGIILIWFLFFLLILESFTGILLGSLLLILYVGGKFLHSGSSTLAKTGFVLVFLIPLVVFGLQVVRVYQLITPKSYYSESEKIKHKYGYTHDLDNPQRENGYYVWRYINDKELTEAWQKRSSLQLRDSTNQALNSYYILLRYLTSKGLKKDSASVWQLTGQDIKNIEQGIPNWIFTKNNPILTRVYKIFWEIESFRKGTDPTFQSISQRMVFLSTGWQIFKENPWIGTGTGDVWDEFRQKYEKSNVFRELHPWMRAHNQYLTFLLSYGILGGGFILFAMFYPIYLQRKKLIFPAMAFFVIAFLSMLTEDTLESQAGVIFFSYFYSLFFLNKTEVNCLK